MKVLLLYPNISGMNMLPPAIGLFTRLLKNEGHEVDLFDSTHWDIPGEDFNSDKEKERLLTARPFDDSKLTEGHQSGDVYRAFRDKVESFDPDLIAVSITEDIFPVAKLLLQKIGDLAIPTILGGVFPTFAPEKCMTLPEVDMVCIGEGEYVLVELCRRMERGNNFDDIPGLWLKTRDGIRKNPIGPPVDFNENPLLDLSLFEDSRLYRPMQGKVWRMLPVETHRGCPYQCTYCNSPSQKRLYWEKTRGHFYRKKSAAAIHKELIFFKDEMKAEAFYFWADTFLSYTDREFNNFCEMYRDIRLPFWMQSRPETVRVDRLKRLMDLGLFRMGLGIEHGNEHFRKTVLKRNVKNEVIVKNLRKIESLNLPYSVNNIIGFPGDTYDLSMDTIELNRQIRPDSSNAYSFSPFHGTTLREVAEKKGYCDPSLIARSVMRPTLLNMPGFPPERIEGLRRCFSLYVTLPKSRWPEIKKAETLTPEGDAIWEALKDECVTLRS